MLSLFYPESPIGSEHSPPKSTAGEISPRYFSSSSSAASPRNTSPGSRASTRNPLSPLDTETFNWPDVRELCSKYAANDEALLAEGNRPWAPPVNRSRSVPENMVEPPQSARVSRCCSLSTKRGQAGPRGPGDLPQHDSDREDDLYVTAHVTLDNNQSVIIMEKEPLPGSALEDSEGLHSPVTMPWQGQDFREHGLKEEGPRDPADPSQQGRVRNLREKFQALNSIG